MKQRKLRHKGNTRETNKTALALFLSSLLAQHKSDIKAAWVLNPKEFEINDDFSIIVLINDLRAKKANKKKIHQTAHVLERKILAQLHVKIHTGFQDLTAFWERIMRNDLRLFVELIESTLVYDEDRFVAPLIALAEQGLIQGTEQSYRRLLGEIKQRMRAAEQHKMKALELLYQAATNAGQAPLIAAGYPIPSQKQVPQYLGNYFVRKKKLERIYQRYCEEIIFFYKECQHNRKTSINAHKLEELTFKAYVLIGRMEDLVEQLWKKKKQH
ncbi:hypothetical protein HZB01_03455 [Candidatus Woesearchaeota archaeon]|nr:hypothetical protein [Candidatus Woesearchaeota archaeon]